LEIVEIDVLIPLGQHLLELPDSFKPLAPYGLEGILLERRRES